MRYSFFGEPDKFEVLANDLQKNVVERLEALDKLAPSPDVEKALELSSELLALYRKATSEPFRQKTVSTTIDSEDSSHLSLPQ